MEDEFFNPLFDVINQTFEKSAKRDLEEKFLTRLHNQGKWMCFSDYCFDDTTKPNDVCCFTLVPYIEDPEELASFVGNLAKTDIKKTKLVDAQFISFLKNYPLVNFSFILNNKKKILGKIVER